MNIRDKKRMTYLGVFIIAITILTKMFTNIPFQAVLCNLVVLLVGSEIIRSDYIKNKAKWLIIMFSAIANLVFAYATLEDADLIIYTIICDIIVVLFAIIKLLLKKYT